MNIKYSEISTMAEGWAVCCDEQMSVCPNCGHAMCVFCADGCDECDATIDWTA